MLGSLEEKNLITSLKQGSAFEQLVELYRRKVVNLCFRFIGNNEDAEDTAQEVFIEVFRSIKNFKEDSKLSTWIYRIAAAKSIDFLRRKNAKKNFSFFSFLSAESEEVISSDKNPHEELEDSDRRKILQRALNKLPDNQQIAITLNKMEGFTNKETAEIMDITVQSVDTLVYRAKKNLEKYLKKYFKHLE
ncbi:MAG: sigma-70 family RNA polymerase sigma factor [Bacteroidetes bacterium]|nr:sigma-70 family RNA polymerase sigma factor [Bacteroidota bacterium]